MDLIAQDKKVKRGKLTFILVRGIGAGVRRARCRSRAGARVSRRETLADTMTASRLAFDPRRLVCLLLSFFFAGSETALMAFSRARMLRLEKNGNRSAGSSTGCWRRASG